MRKSLYAILLLKYVQPLSRPAQASEPGIPVGATVEDVKLMKSVVGDAVKVKAAGGVRNLADALAMIEAGAERIGTSAGVKIIEELKAQL